MFTFLDHQTDESLLVPVVARNTYGEQFSLPLGDTMIHVVDHATYHRGQINSMIMMARGNRQRPTISVISPLTKS